LDAKYFDSAGILRTNKDPRGFHFVVRSSLGQLRFDPTPAAGERIVARRPDAEIGAIFTNMRLCLDLPRHGLAHHFQTDEATIAAFELGLLDRLPPWPETQRLVVAYAAACRIDPRPLLMRLQLHFGFAPPPPQPAPNTARTGVRALPPPDARTARQSARPAPPPRPTSRDDDVVTRRRRRRSRRLYAMTAPFVVAGGLFALIAGAPGLAYSLASMLPEPAGAYLRKTVEMVVVVAAPERDGLRWIDVPDPKSRKAARITGKL
jgi:hypothetical protein